MKRIAITAGDSSGIGGEVILKALAALIPTLPACTHQFHCYGDTVYWQRSNNALYTMLKQSPAVVFHSIQSNLLPGQHALACLDQAVAAIDAKQADALVTGPINKQHLQLVGCKHMGHTDWLAAKTGVSDVSMAFWSPVLCVVLATVHCPLKSVPALITPDRLNQAIQHAGLLFQALGIQSPRLAIAGLNPHAGEAGLIGSEEQDCIAPVIQDYVASNAKLNQVHNGMSVSGPYPPDTVFLQAVQDKFDGVIALYHDQGLIPIKLLAFDKAVNITLGLPFVRTSPDHGTAIDIAFQDKANCQSMQSAIQLALRLVP